MTATAGKSARDRPVGPGSEDPSVPPIPWFGPTLHELVPGIPPGTRPFPLRRLAAKALTEARRDPARHQLLQHADRSSSSPVTALVAEMLTPPLPPPAAETGHATEEQP
ncbi:hypothetical protein [Streptomyces sp. CB02414]|uniref:hypothetical protein n=1 Tax=Streptomyces sp. CB02414 TaxID=1703922 RepID=UPI00093B3B26|nr:hypothetical protein [Streptomyces sp. CB02414]OKI75222.1 hypothetical protein AMK11_34340 [Streptomyces sp. CB02414]